MRKVFIGSALCAMLFALCPSAEAQQSAKIPRIGYVSSAGDPNNPGSQIDRFRQGLRDLGYVAGKNILIEFRYAEGKPDRVPNLVAELVQLKVDVIVLNGGEPLIRAAMNATRIIPIRNDGFWTRSCRGGRNIRCFPTHR